MLRESLNDLHAFVIVAQERSFTRAAARLNLSQSAVSHAMRGLESRLGVRLLNRSTRSVSPTQAGEKLLLSLAPTFDAMERDLAELSDFREKPAGTVRITTTEHAAQNILWPKLRPLLQAYPDIRLELSVDYSLTDIVAERFDAGVRIGEQVAKDMIAIPIGPDLRMAIVGSPDYFRDRPRPTHPQDLLGQSCINLRLPTSGGFLPWEFEKDGKVLNVHVDGQVSFNLGTHILDAALQGFGLGYLPHDMVERFLIEGRLIRVLEDWCPPFDGYHLYYPSHRQPSPAFRLVVEALRHRSPKISRIE